MLGKYLGSGRLKNLRLLDLSHCPIQVSLDPLVEGCPVLREFILTGDSWVRKLVLESIARFKALEIFHMGHFEHSDCDCKSVMPKDPVFSDYSAKGYTVSKVFDDPNNFPKLGVLFLEQHCELSKFLIEWIRDFRPSLQIKFNYNMSALTENIEINEQSFY